MANPRIYVDTSVFGGVFESEFKWASEALFQQIRGGSFTLVTSAVVQDEIEPAPPHVRELFETMLPYAELIYPNPDAVTLQQAYIQSNILTPKYADDALHVALATVSGCALIVSWNFKH
jgi:predicted nucleic acid-binding protein